jgi:hypothetical protein
MRSVRPVIPGLCLSLFAACASPEPPTGPSLALSGNGVQSLVNGSYTANIGAVAPIIGVYDLSGKIDRDGASSGEFSFYAETTTGTIAFAGRITCLVFDDPLKRAWIGAVITANSSTRPSHDGTQVIHRVGHDVWFRVADRSPGGSGDPDRTTFLGFEGSGMIATSADYCALHAWGNDGVPTLSGNLTVR